MKFNEIAFKDLQGWASEENEQDFCLLIKKVKEIDVLAANKLTECGLCFQRQDLHPDFMDFLEVSILTIPRFLK